MHAEADNPAVYHAEAVFAQSAEAVVYLRILREDDSLKATGTAVLVSSEGKAATAYHVVKGAERIEGTLRDGRVISSIEVIGYDEQRDAAILQLPPAEQGDGEPYEFLPVRETAVNYGEQVFAIGFPMANTPIITEGIVNSPSAEVNGRERMLISAQVASGMSGGPVIDRFGRIAGIISGSLRTMNNIHLAVHTEDLRSLLSEPVKLP